MVQLQTIVQKAHLPTTALQDQLAITVQREVLAGPRAGRGIIKLKNPYKIRVFYTINIDDISIKLSYFEAIASSLRKLAICSKK